MENAISSKVFLAIVLLFGLLFIFDGCTDEVYVVRPDRSPPSVPKGVYSITGNEAVYLFWEENDEADFKEYRVYRSDDKDGPYYRIGITKIAKYTDYGPDVENGFTYWYAVTAKDDNGNESNFSYIMYDTPRPDGVSQIQDYHLFPNTSGYDFSKYAVVAYDDKRADIYLDYDSYYGVFFLCVTDDTTDIQDFGYTDRLDDVNVAPEDGWSELGWVEVILGHSYIIWTRDNHFAQLRVNDVTIPYRIVFEWAYQTDQGNTELAPRPSHGENYLRIAQGKKDKSVE